MSSELLPTLERGYAMGRPESRPVHPLDAVIAAAIEALPAATRLYPDVFAWAVTDAVVEACKQAEVRA